MNQIKPNAEPRGFTLVELLVVIAIIGILMSMILPAVQSARESGRKAACMNNIRQLQLAMVSHEEGKKTFPPGRDGCAGETFGACGSVPSNMRRGISGFVLLLPYLEEMTLYRNIDIPQMWPLSANIETNGNDSTSWVAANLAVVRYQMPLMRCPSDLSERTYAPSSASMQDNLEAAVGSYAMCAGTYGAPSYGQTEKVDNSGVFRYYLQTKAAHVKDGLSKTFFLGEVAFGSSRESSNRWTAAARLVDTLRNTVNPPNTTPGEGVVLNLYGYKTNGGFGSHHTGGTYFAFGDTRTVFVSDEIDQKIYSASASRAGGESLTYAE